MRDLEHISKEKFMQFCKARNLQGHWHLLSKERQSEWVVDVGTHLLSCMDTILEDKELFPVPTKGTAQGGYERGFHGGQHWENARVDARLKAYRKLIEDQMEQWK